MENSSVAVHRDTRSAALLASADLSAPMSVTQRQAQINVIQELMRNNMKDGTHYGKVFAGAKPSLWKAGAELIAMTLRIALDHAVEDLSTDDYVRFRVRAVATRQADGLFLGATYGECWSNEQKYMWREAVVQAEYDDTPEDRRRKKYEATKTKEGFKVVYQVRAHPADVSNTILKMACKRADIATVLIVTAASDIFTQDLEDMPAELHANITDVDRAEAIEVQDVKRASEVKPEATPETATPGIRVTETRIAKTVPGKDGKGGWTLFKIRTSDGVERATFSKSIYELAIKAKESNASISFEGEESSKGFAITSLEILS